MKILRYFLLLAILLLGSRWPASAQVFEWAKLARGSSRALPGGTAGATDQAGNTYAAITFQDTLRVGTQVLLAAAGTSAVVKYDSTGQVLWARQLRNITLQNGLVVDPANGGIFVLGQALSGATWGAPPWPRVALPAAFMANARPQAPCNGRGRSRSCWAHTATGHRTGRAAL